MISDFTKLATLVGQELQKKSLVLSIAESCTGGLASQVITAVPGSSAWFDRGFITYSNEAKEEMLDVRESTIKRYGAVSEKTVKEMALGALKHSRADVSISITGIAGPTGGTSKKPIGTVYFGLASEKKPVKVFYKHFKGNREFVRKQAVFFILQELIVYVGS